jgi:peptide subunit release factor RF-3
LPYRHARWIVGDARALAGLQWPYFGCMRALDRQDRLVALFASTHAIEYFVKENPDVDLSAIG